MGLESIGVKAVVENISGYLNDINKMNKATADAGDQTEKAAKKSEAMSKALAGIGKVVAGLGLTGLFAGMIKSASDSQSAIAELDAVLKSTKNAVIEIGGAADQSSGSIDIWQKGLESASKTVAELQSKVMAGIPLTKEESKTLVDAGQEAAKYQAAIDKAMASKQGLNTTTKKGIKVTHLDRQAYLDLASALQNVTRFSDETILSGENMLLTFTNIGKDIFPRATKAVLDYAAKFGNVEQAAIAIGKALQDPITGVTNLRRVGVMLSQQQEDQIKKFMAVGNVAGAQAIILKELETEFGGLAVAAGSTFAGKMDILKNKFDDVMEAAGGKLLPVLTQLVDGVGKFLDSLGPLAPTLLLVAAGIGAVALAMGPLGAIMAVILSPIGAIIGAVVGLGLAFQTNFLGIRDIVMNVWNQIKPLVKDIQDIITGLFSGVDVGSSLRDLGWRIQHGLELMFASIGLDPRIIQQVIDVLNGIATWFTQTALPTVLDFITNTVVPGIQGFIDTLVRIWTDVSPFLNDLMNWFITEGLPAIQGAIDWFMVNVGQPLVDLLKSLWDAVRPALENLYTWFVTEGLPKIKTAAYDLWQKVLVPLANLLMDVWNKFAKPGLEALAQFFREHGPEIGNFIANNITGPFNALLGVLKDVVDWVGKVISKVNEFLQINATNSVQNKAGVVVGSQGIILPGSNAIAPGQAPYSNSLLRNNPYHRAGGGPFNAGDTFWTGERGPELVSFGRSGFVFPNSAIAAMASAMPAASGSNYAYNNVYNNQQSQGDINMYNVQGANDAIRRMAVLRAMGRIR